MSRNVPTGEITSPMLTGLINQTPSAVHHSLFTVYHLQTCFSSQKLLKFHPSVPDPTIFGILSPPSADSSWELQFNSHTRNAIMKMLKTILVLFIFMYLQTDTLMSQWTQIGLTTDRIISLAVGSNGYIYAGTYSNGAYKSTNNGTTWIPCLSPGLYGVYEVYSLAAGGPDTIYAGSYATGIYRTTNSGDSWGNPSDMAGSFLPSGDVFAVAIGPTGTVYAAHGGNMWNSKDKGRNWTEVKNSSLGGTSGFQTIAFGTSSVYIGGSTDWFYYSNNDGSNWTWEGSSSGLAHAPMTLAVNASGTLFAGTSSSGVYKSTNGGINWTALSANPGDLHINILAISSTGVIYAGTTNGIYFSIDNGLTWASDNSGLTNTDIRSLAFDSLGNVLAGAYKNDGTGGLWRSVAIVPVELTAFTALQKERTAVLRWNTATEINNYGFEVERRKVSESMSSGAIEWSKVGFVNGAGTSNTEHTYSFADANVSSGTYVYRLKQIDNDGTYKYSGEAEVTIAVPKEFALNQNFPNPFNPSTTIAFDIPEQSQVTLKIYDLLGKEVATLVNNEVVAAGNHTKQWNASNIPSGVYFYKLIAGNYTATKKLVLMK